MNVRQAKAFIKWARSQKIVRIKIDDVEVEFSPLAFASDYEALESEHIEVENEKESKEQYDKTLFASI